MAKRSYPSYGGGMPANMNNLMKQAQKMQRQMEEMQQELAVSEFEGTAGGGAVTVKVSGGKELTSVTISPAAVDPDDVEMLQDLIVAAVNEALRKVDAFSSNKMGDLTGGMPGLGGSLGGGLPGGMGGLF